MVALAAGSSSRSTEISYQTKTTTVMLGCPDKLLRPALQQQFKFFLSPHKIGQVGCVQRPLSSDKSHVIGQIGRQKGASADMRIFATTAESV